MMLNSQAEHITRVRSRIADLVLQFVTARLRADSPIFHMEELTNYVRQFVSVAPDSPRRIFTDLAKQNEFGYTVLSRRRSEYRLIPQRCIQRSLFGE